MEDVDCSHRRAIVGNPRRPRGFWLYDSKTGYDLTHPDTPLSATISTAISFETATEPIKVDPAKSALVIVDMQNFFLSPLIGRPKDSNGLKAQQHLLDCAIPAARKAGIRIVWLNWGLTQEEIDDMPPALVRDFGFTTVAASQFESWASTLVGTTSQEQAPTSEEPSQGFDTKLGPSNKNSQIYVGLGSEIGNLEGAELSEPIDGGRLLMRDQWNTDLTPELRAAYETGKTCNRPDAWAHKIRLSGLGGASTHATEVLDRNGIKTLFFAGVNTDQCVGGSIQDAFTRGYDVILLSDGSATTSPSYVQDAIELNCKKSWGFCMRCEQFWEGVSKAQP